MQPALGKVPRDGPREASLAIERFLKASQKPVLMEPGEDPLAITPETFVAAARAGSLVIECWNEARNVTRRVAGVKLERPGRLELEIETFGARTGARGGTHKSRGGANRATLSLIDLARPSNSDATRRGARLKYRERFRQSLQRQFPDWRIVELSAEPDLEHSLSPRYPRALLRKGQTGLAAIGAPEDAAEPESALTFGLIWLDYLQHRERRLVMEGLAIFVPAGTEAATCHRVRHLNPKAARYLVFVHDPAGWEQRVNPGDYTNLETRLEPCLLPLPGASAELSGWVERLGRIAGVAQVERACGSVSFGVNGLEFARIGKDGLVYGLDRKQALRSGAQFHEVEDLARGLVRVRNAEADRANPLYARHPEAWLEASIRSEVEALDATLLRSPLYGQVPEMAGRTRRILDLVGVDGQGRLAILELKASQDLHLPLQALDYWMRVKWHLERGEFTKHGYFPGIALKSDPPRLLLVAPALEWHPANVTVLKYFDAGIDVARIGIGLEWRRGMKVMFRSGDEIT